MQPVLWTKGVLLSPQHFQTQDRFLEDLLEFQLSALTFCPWGFHRLEIDREALASGSFGLSAASGILPDGLMFDMPASETAPPPKPLEGAFAADQEWLDVYLGVPEYQYGGLNVSGVNRDRDARYRAEELLRRDETTGQAERPIQVARRNFRILFEGESLEGTSALRVARVTRSADGRLSARPAVRAAARRHRRERLPDGIGAPAGRDPVGEEHDARRRATPEKSEPRRVRRRGRRELLAAVHDQQLFPGAAPPLRDAARPSGRAVSRDAGARGITDDVLGHDPPARAADATSTTISPACFTRLDAQVRELLETVVPATTVSLPMKLVQPSVYAAALDQDKYLAAPQIYLAITVDGRGVDVAGRAPHLVKVSAAGQLDTLIRQALPGVPLTYVPNPPSAVSVKVNHTYFLLQKSGAEWDNIARARNVAAYVPAEFPNRAARAGGDPAAHC